MAYQTKTGKQKLMNKEEIGFTSWIIGLAEGPTQVFTFFVNGEVELAALLLEEAKAKYPLDKYKWVFFDGGA